MSHHEHASVNFDIRPLLTPMFLGFGAIIFLGALFENLGKGGNKPSAPSGGGHGGH